MTRDPNRIPQEIVEVLPALQYNECWQILLDLIELGYAEERAYLEEHPEARPFIETLVQCGLVRHRRPLLSIPFYVLIEPTRTAIKLTHAILDAMLPPVETTP